MSEWIGAIVFAAGVFALWRAASLARTRGAARSRLRDEERVADDLDQTASTESGLRHWLARAGFDDESAPSRFLLATGLGFGLGLFIVLGLQALGTLSQFEVFLLETPGGVGEALLPIAWATPYLIVILATAYPWLRVRGARRDLVRSVERDLSTTLELLASLARAGLGFDAALDRVLTASPRDRALFSGFERFRRDLKGGRTRVEALRQFANRLDVPRVRTLVSALVQAERVGAGLSDTLRRQADDLRQSRRELALAKAQALPAKLVFPLVICFLPGIFVLTLGPAFFSFLAESASFGVGR